MTLLADVGPLADRWTVVQAEAHGVTGTRQDGTAYLPRKLSDVAPGAWFRLYRLPGVTPSRALNFARGEVGSHYGFVTIASIAFEKATPSWLHVPIRRPGTWICSALAAETEARGGWYHRWPDLYEPTPAEVLHAMLAAGAVEVKLADARPGDVGFSHGKGLIAAAIRFAERGTPDSDVNHAFLLDRKAA